ncbi:MAG: M56 family metallopeptidase [Clostridiales bacterium]|nr:M56 family metallopeptidase [Clostridiales bacterium]
MLGLFETILNLSLIGSVVIVLIVIVRRLLRRLPTKYIYALWALVAIKLLCPKSPSSVLSVFNYLPKKKISVSSTVRSAFNGVSSTGAVSSSESSSAVGALRTVVRTSPASSAAETSGSFPDIWQILMFLWIIGMVVLLCAVCYKTWITYRSLRNTSRIEENVYSGPSVRTPFVFGLFRPRIYMPQGLSGNEYRYLLHHEKTHIKRKDMLFQVIGITTLILHWFNPLVWLAFRLFENDMEMSCDEEVIKNIGTDLRADYCISLVTYARKSSIPEYLVSTISFGKKDVKERIKNIMKYRKISTVLSVLCVVAVSTVFVCGFLSPVENKISASKSDETVSTETEKETTEETSVIAPSETADAAEAIETSVTAPDDSDETAVLESISFETVIVGSEVEIVINESEPLWGTPEWIESHQNKTIAEIPENSLSDGVFFTLNLPKPSCSILKETRLEKGAALPSDTIFVSFDDASTSPVDMIIYETEALSEAEFTSFVQSLKDFGFKDALYQGHTYIGYTDDGLYATIESVGDDRAHDVICISSSSRAEDDLIGLG